jgi:hypothetical protein
VDREEKGSVMRVGMRDGSALRLVSGSVRRPGSSSRIGIKSESERTSDVDASHRIAVGLGRRKVENGGFCSIYSKGMLDTARASYPIGEMGSRANIKTENKRRRI